MVSVARSLFRSTFAPLLIHSLLLKLHLYDLSSQVTRIDFPLDKLLSHTSHTHISLSRSSFLSSASIPRECAAEIVLFLLRERVVGGDIVFC